MDSAKLIEQLALQVPALVVLVILVWQFLNYMQYQRKDFTGLISRLHEEHQDARALTRQAMENNAKAMLEMSKSLTVLSEAVRHCPLDHGK